MRLATSIATVALLAALAGCGSSGEADTTSSPPSSTSQIRGAWERDPSCERPPGASRWGCSVGSYRCQSVVTDRGWSTSCSRPGRSISFTVRP